MNAPTTPNHLMPAVAQRAVPEALIQQLKALFGEPTSVGTGVVTHTFASGKPSLPSLTLETGLPDIPAWFVASGVMVNSLQVGFARSGAANATVGLVAQGEVRRTATLDDTPASRDLQRFNQFQGQVLREGQARL